MKIKFFALATLAIFIAAGSVFAARYGRANNNISSNQNGANLIASLPYDAPNDEETAGIVKMREEEKLARDVYITLNEKWNLAVFSNIAVSEQRHMDAVKALIDRYGIEDPVTDDSVGAFTNPNIKALYDQLTTTGGESVEKALWVGATIEDLDIFDLNELINSTDNVDILTVYQNLAKGSRNHLRSFGAMLASYGLDYQAQYLTQDEVDAIINSDRERGRYDANGNQVSGPRQGNRGRQGRQYGSNQRGYAGHGPNFVDKNGDGICDYRQ